MSVNEEKYKIVTVIGTRPELIKMSLVLKVFDESFEHYFVHTGQNFDYHLNEIFFNDLSIREPDYYLNANGGSFAENIAKIFVECLQLFSKLKPDALVIYGDTNSCLCAYIAKRLGIPVFHLEAGNRCYDNRVPEEINRKIIDHISDINMVLSENARGNLILEGISPDKIFNVGSNMNEILSVYGKEISKSTILEKWDLKKDDYIILNLHREENVSDEVGIKTLIKNIRKISEKYQKKIVWPIHPRTNSIIEKLDLIKSQKSYLIIKPLGFFDYIHLQVNCFCMISDSGTVSEEASLLGIPTITVRFSTERPEGIENGIFSMMSINSNPIPHIELARQSRSSKPVTNVYKNTYNSLTIAKIVLSFVEKQKLNTRTR